jgi:hypothetical protein
LHAVHRSFAGELLQCWAAATATGAAAPREGKEPDGALSSFAMK